MKNIVCPAQLGMMRNDSTFKIFTSSLVVTASLSETMVRQVFTAPKDDKTVGCDNYHTQLLLQTKCEDKICKGRAARHRAECLLPRS